MKFGGIVKSVRIGFLGGEENALVLLQKEREEHFKLSGVAEQRSKL